jgi:hypothetical protein
VQVDCRFALKEQALPLFDRGGSGHMFANNDLLVLTPPLAIFVLAVFIVACLPNDLSAFCSGNLAPIHSLHCLSQLKP